MVDVMELELLEALHRVGGHTVNDVLRSWKSSSQSELRLFLYLQSKNTFPNIAVGSLYPVEEVDVCKVAVERLGLDKESR